MYHLAPLNLKKSCDGRTVDFELHDVELAMVNALRRIILTDIENVAFYCEPFETNRSVLVIKNTGALHNEFILHRISLLPICLSKMQIRGFKSSDWLFTLHAVNKTSAMMNVSSGDIEVTYRGKVQNDPVFPIFPKNSITGDTILITKLRPGEELHLEGRAEKNTARTFAGFQAVSACYHTFIRDNQRVEKAFEALKVTEAFKALLPAEQEKAISKFWLLDSDRQYHVNEFGDPNRFRFHIESECALKPMHIFREAVRVLKQKFMQLKKRLDGVKGVKDDEDDELLVKARFDAIPNAYQFTFKDEDDTVGFLLQSHILQKFIRDGEKFEGFTVSYVGYCVPHPLDRKMVLRIILSNDGAETMIPDIVYERLLSATLWELGDELSVSVA